MSTTLPDEIITPLEAWGNEQYDKGVSDQAAADAAEIEDLKAEIAALENPVTPPPPSSGKLDAGVYRSGNNADLATYCAGWKLTASTFYVNHGQRASHVPSIEAALKAGRNAYIAIDTKLSASSYTAFADVTAHKIDTDLAAWRTDLNALLQKYPSRTIHVAIAHEAELGKRNAADTASSFIAMANYFADFMHGAGSKLLTNYWAASGTNTNFYPDHTKFDLGTADVYYRGTSAHGMTVAQVLANWMKARSSAGWGSVPAGLTETGIVVNKFTSAEQIAWWQTWPAAIKQYGLVLLESFLDDRDLEYVPTDPAVKSAIQAMYATL